MDSLDARRLELASLRCAELIRDAEKMVERTSQATRIAQKLRRREHSSFEQIRENLVSRRSELKEGRGDTILVAQRLQQLKASKHRLNQRDCELAQASDLLENSCKLLAQRDLVGKGVEEKLHTLKLNSVVEREESSLEEVSALYCLRNLKSEECRPRVDEVRGDYAYDGVNAVSQDSNLDGGDGGDREERRAESTSQNPEPRGASEGWSQARSGEQVGRFLSSAEQSGGHLSQHSGSASKCDPQSEAAVQEQGLAAKIEEFLSWDNRAESGVTFIYQSKAQERYEILVKESKRRMGVEIEICAQSQRGFSSIQGAKAEILRTLSEANIKVAIMRIGTNEKEIEGKHGRN